MKKFRFLVNDNKLSGALFFPKELKPKNPTIFFIHGWTGEKKRCYQYAKALVKFGYICFLFDMRGHGKSEGDRNKTTIKEFFDDVVAVYDYLITRKEIDVDNISVVGNSFGAYLAMLLSAKRKMNRLVLRAPANYPNDALLKLKTETSGTTNQSVFEWRKKSKKPSETFSLEAMSKFQGEVLIIEAENDDVVPHEAIENLRNSVEDKSKLSHEVIKNGPHSIRKGPFRDQVEEILTDWFVR